MSYKVHYWSGTVNPIGVHKLACGRMQQLCALNETRNLFDVTCAACKREIKARFNGEQQMASTYADISLSGVPGALGGITE